MNNKTPTEIEERFKDIMEKKLNNRFISAGTLMRFRDACFKEGQKQERDNVLKEFDLWYKWDFYNIKSKSKLLIKYKKLGYDVNDINFYQIDLLVRLILEELKSKLSGGNDGKED